MQWDIDAAAELLRDVGYTPEEVVIDHEMYSIDPPSQILGVSRYL